MNTHLDSSPVRGRLRPRSPRRLLTAIASYLALTACENAAPRPEIPSSAPAQTPTAAAEASAAPSPGPLYHATNKPCDLVDHQLLAQLFGPDINDITPPQYTQNKLHTTMTCHRSYSQQGAGTTVVPVRLQLADPAAIEAHYQGLRRLIEGRTAVTDVPGLGQSAYTYLDKSTGPQLALHDGNAYLSIGAVPVADPTPPAICTFPVLIQVAQKVLATLKSRSTPRNRLWC